MKKLSRIKLLAVVHDPSWGGPVAAGHEDGGSAAPGAPAAPVEPRSAPLHTVLLSQDDSPHTAEQAAGLGVESVLAGSGGRDALRARLMDAFRVSADEIALMLLQGNGLAPIRSPGFTFAVADSAGPVKNAADYVTRARGGPSAIREAVDIILRARGEPVLHIAGRTVGEGHPCLVISEIGNNHQGRPELARKLIDMSLAAGVDAVKFQKRDNHALLTRRAFCKAYGGRHSFSNTYGGHRERLELRSDDFKDLKEYAEAAGLICFTSVWDEKSLSCLEELDLPLYKIPSADLTNIKLLERVAELGKPTLLSTGMSHLHEIDRAVDVFLRHHDRLVLMHCVSTYPHPPRMANMRMIETLRRRYGLLVGYSSHEEGILVTGAAALMGAVAIEKHVTLDQGMKGSDHRSSADKAQLIRMVELIRLYENARGDGVKGFSRSEVAMRRKLGKSIVAARDIRMGEVLTWENMAYKCALNGMYALDMDQVFGRVAARDIKQDELITEATIQGS
jgi:sialic acid synthase